MKYDDEYIKNLFLNNDLETFLSTVNVENVSDPRLKAIIASLQRGVDVLKLEFNPIPKRKRKKRVNTRK